MSDCSTNAFKVPEPELLPCPFCGGEVTTILNCMKVEECEKFEECDNVGLSIVICDYNNGGCGASTGYRLTKKEAIEAWNRRYEPTCQLETVWNDVGAMTIGEYKCSVCGESYEGYPHNRCPNCGRKVVEVVD